MVGSCSAASTDSGEHTWGAGSALPPRKAQQAASGQELGLGGTAAQPALEACRTGRVRRKDLCAGGKLMKSTLPERCSGHQ